MTALDDLMAAVGTAVDTYTPAITGPLTQQITDLTAEVAGLQTQLAAVPQPTLWGSTFSKPPATITAAFGPLSFGRFYDGAKGLLAAVASGKKAGWGVGLSGRFSCKYDLSAPGLAALLAGAHDFDIIAGGKSLTAADKVAPFHEMNVKIKQGVYTADAFRQGWQYVVTVLRANGCPPKIVQCWSTPVTFEAEYVGDDWCDEVAIDPYTWTPGQSVAQLVGPMLTSLRTFTAKPVNIWEIGCTYTDPAARAAFFQSAGWLVGKFGDVGVYNDTAAGVDYSIDGNPGAAAAVKALAGVGR